MNKVSLSTIFEIKYGNSLDLNVLEVCDRKIIGSVNYVSRTEKNNGVSAVVKKIVDIEPFPGGLITVAGSGNSVLEACIQPEPFYTGFHVFVLQEKKKLTDLEKLFFCFCIKQNRYRYSYGRQANKTLKNIIVPLEIPKEFKAISLNKLLNVNENSAIKKNVELSVKNWKKFKYGGPSGVFEIKNGYYNKKPDASEKGNIPFIGSSEFNNGVTEFYTLDDIVNNDKDEKSASHEIGQKIFKGNSVTVANNGASVSSAFYQEKDFTCSHDVNVLYLKDRQWNKYIALFICTLINLEKYRWSYGRKWRPSRMPYSEIKLPAKHDGSPDFDFMETYIKSLPFSASL